MDPELEAAAERYRTATDLLERERARVEVDLLALRREALRTVRAAVRAGDAWMLEQVRELLSEVTRDY